MVQATTPTFVLTLPNSVDLTQARNVYFTLKQGGNILTKTDTDIAVTEHTATVSLTQGDALMFDAGGADLQLNWTYADGSRACTNIANVQITANLLKAVIE